MPLLRSIGGLDSNDFTKREGFISAAPLTEFYALRWKKSWNPISTPGVPLGRVLITTNITLGNSRQFDTL